MSVNFYAYGFGSVGDFQKASRKEKFGLSWFRFNVYIWKYQTLLLK